MPYTYTVREDIVISEDNEVFTVYGIEVIEKGRVIQSFSDIFFDKEEAELLAKLCNENELEPIHLKGVLEDALL